MKWFLLMQENDSIAPNTVESTTKLTETNTGGYGVAANLLSIHADGLSDLGLTADAGSICLSSERFETEAPPPGLLTVRDPPSHHSLSTHLRLE